MDTSDLLQGMFAPFDAKAWERFREWDSEAAAYLLDAVRAGVTDEQIRDYGAAHGYFESSINWLAHAAAWLRRQPGGEEGAAVVEPVAPVGPPTPLKRIHDGEKIETTSSGVVYRYMTATVDPRYRPPARTDE